MALLFGLSLLLAACDDSSVREFLAELFPPPAESSGDEVAGEDAGDASEDPSEDGADDEGADEGSESGDASDNERCINRNEHRGSLRSPRLRDERRTNDNDDAGDQGDQQQEPEEDDASDEPSEQDEPEGAGDASEDDDGPAERQRPRRERPPADDNGEDEEDGGGQSSGLSNVEQQVFDLLSAEREGAGLSPLQLDSTLSQGARAWSRRMATEGFFEHDTSGNFSENIAYGYPNAAAVHQGWMDSEGHRRNRMNSQYTRYGVGVYKQGNTLYYTERFR